MDEPALLSLALSPKTDADRERLALGLRTLMAEDPTLRLTGGLLTGEVVIAAMSELQLEIVVDRLGREFKVQAGVGRPQVAYKGTFTRSAEGEMKYARQIDGRNQYAHVRIRLHPGESGSGYVFESRILGGAVPDEFIQSVNDGIREALADGFVAGYPIDDVRIELHDGSYHDTDSSEAAFKVAGAMAFRDAARKAAPVLLEPVMRVDVVAPNEFVRDVETDLESRRGDIQSREDRGGTQIIRAHVPLAELFGYPSNLHSRTRGRGTVVTQFDRYQPVRPADDDEAQASFARVPRRPAPAPRSSGVALPEPEDGAPD